MTKTKTFTLIFLLSLLQGCEEITKPNIDYVKPASTGLVSQNNSVYSNALVCLGGLISADNQAGDKGVTMSVGLIQDKTGREIDSSPLTQAASEMALTSLSRINAIDLVGSTDIRDILQYNFSHVDQNLLVNQVALGSLGSIVPSDVFITGAITEYNKDIRGRNWGVNLFGKLVDIGLSGDDSIINVAMDLRLVNAKTGRVLRSGTGKLLTVSLQNNVVTKSYDGSLFRVSTSLGVGGNYAIRIADPLHLAVREIIERATLMLVGELYELSWQQCDKEEAPPRLEPPKTPVELGQW